MDATSIDVMVFMDDSCCGLFYCWATARETAFIRPVAVSSSKPPAKMTLFPADMISTTNELSARCWR